MRVSSLINSENKKVGVAVACRAVLTPGLWQNAKRERLCLAQMPRTPSEEKWGHLDHSGWTRRDRVLSTALVLHNHEPTGLSIGTPIKMRFAKRTLPGVRHRSSAQHASSAELAVHTFEKS